MGRTAAFTLNPLGILGFVCFNARNSYNRIFRHCREAETQLSGRSAARRGVPPVPQPHGAQGLPEPRAHLPASRPPRSCPSPGSSPGSAGPEPSAAPVRTYSRAGPSREQQRPAPEPQLSRRGTGGGDTRIEGAGPRPGRPGDARSRWRRDSRGAGNPGGGAPAADMALNTPL